MATARAGFKPALTAGNPGLSPAFSLRTFRQCKGLSQEDFSEVSSQTYISQLERGHKSPFLDMLSMLAKPMGVHPFSPIVLAFLKSESSTIPMQRLLGYEKVTACRS